MRRSFVSCLLPLLLAACGDDSTTPPGTDAGPGSDGSAPDGGPGDNGVKYDETYTTSDCSPPPACAGAELATACACVAAPASDMGGMPLRVARTPCSTFVSMENPTPSLEIDYCDEASGAHPVDIACDQPGHYRTAGTPMMITLFGVVDVFGNGGDADNIVVEVYEEGSDAMLGRMAGTDTSDVDDPMAQTETLFMNDMPSGQRRLGYYEIPNVPTETALIVHTLGAPPDGAEFWKELYTYDIYIANDEVTAGRHEYRARILSRSDYRSIPSTAGLPGGIPAGRGAVAGEIHDCGDVRLAYVQVATNPEPQVLTYFNDSPDNPLPDIGRHEGTSVLGLYAALDLPVGPVDVSAVGYVEGEGPVSFGWYHARVFANAVTAVTLRGLRPFQTMSSSP